MAAPVYRAAVYLRISRDEANQEESSSIQNQRQIIRDYCTRKGITVVREYVDDGWSGGTFERPQFQQMLRELEPLGMNMVITKDLSRLGRDMSESGRYAEEYFPSRGIRYITVTDGFDSEDPAAMAPFLYAVNDYYLREGSKKVRNILKNKRENGLYCASAPYGYKKAEGDRNHLVPEESTAAVVRKIFRLAGEGQSARAIAMSLTAQGVPTPSQSRGTRGAAAAWSMTTVKRILSSQVYLGHTVLGRQRKASYKSKAKRPVDRAQWAVTRNTHTPLVTQEEYDAAHRHMGRAGRDFRQYPQVRRSVFSGVAFCGLCGHALCSGGTTYKGERERYWTLSCTHQRQDISNPCPGVRVDYAKLVELVKGELNRLIALSEADMAALTEGWMAQNGAGAQRRVIEEELRRLGQEMEVVRTTLSKSYEDHAAGLLPDGLFDTLRAEWNQRYQRLEERAKALRTALSDLPDPAENYRKFLELVRGWTEIDELDRETVQTFIQRIEVWPKVLPEGRVRTTHRGQPYRQRIKIYYRFVGELGEDQTGLTCTFPPVCGIIGRKQGERHPDSLRPEGPILP